jgi:hypothetical protein
MLLRWFLPLLIFRPWRWRRYDLPKRRLTFNGLHGFISQKIALFITTAVRTSNFTTDPLISCLQIYQSDGNKDTIVIHEISWSPIERLLYKRLREKSKIGDISSMNFILCAFCVNTPSLEFSGGALQSSSQNNGVSWVPLLWNVFVAYGGYGLFDFTFPMLFYGGKYVDRNWLGIKPTLVTAKLFLRYCFSKNNGFRFCSFKRRASWEKQGVSEKRTGQQFIYVYK